MLLIRFKKITKALCFISVFAIFQMSCAKEKFAELEVVTEDTIVDPVPDTIPVSSFSDTIMRGVNWADPSDNFKDSLIILTGLNSNDTYSVTAEKSARILKAFQSIGANTVRLPINPPTVLTPWWDSYTAAIDQSVQKGLRVVLCCWESYSFRDGKVDDYAKFWEMWQKVISKYGNNSSVYFEIINEPFSYGYAELTNLYDQWLTNYSSVPKKRVLLDGTGYAQFVNGIGSESRFKECFLSYHNYTWLNKNLTVADWEGAILSIDYPERTVVTEFGIPMSHGKNYLTPSTADRDEAYFQGITNVIRAKKMGSIHWPGLREGDSYSLLTLNKNNLSINNRSGLTRLQYAWGIENLNTTYASFDSGVVYKIVNRNSNKLLQVKDSSISDSAKIIQWDFLSHPRQTWYITSLGNGYFNIINSKSGKVLDIISSSTSAEVVQNAKNGSASQQWLIVDVGFGYYKIINNSNNSSLDLMHASLDNGAEVIPWFFHGGINQQWKIEKL